MKNVALFEAKTHFSSLIVAVVEQKEEVIITKRGEMVAKIIPFTEGKKRPIADVIQDMKLLNKDVRKNVKLTVEDIQEMREEGRRC